MLPVEDVLPELRTALRERGEAVLVAPPGAGKTTRVPPGLLDEPWAQTGKIVLLSPRRIAARAAAARMAAERGERVGETIGYRVRMDSKVSARTRIEVVTEGVFTRMILDDPELSGVAAVLFDEFHERSLEGDLGLALARDAQGALRADLKIVVMSATLDAARVASLLGGAPVVVSDGRMFPVRHVYRPRMANSFLEKDVVAATQAALAAESGSALVFLPGMAEIERCAEKLRTEITDPNTDVRPLYGAMSAEDQDAAISPAPAGRRKVVLATSIAETSLTIEGVRIVVDSGVARRPRYEPALGLTRLETVRASQAAVTQRAGRAGRLEPGVAYRLWSEGETRALPEFDRPEMFDADLSSLVLDLATWGVSDPAALSWLDPPPKPAWTEAVALLKRIGALDDEGRLTPHGKLVAKLPLPPRLAHMVIAAKGDQRMAARIAVIMTEHGVAGRDVDLRQRLITFGHRRGQRLDQARRLADRIAVMAVDGDKSVLDQEERPWHAGLVLALAFPDRVAARRGDAFLMANGRAALLDGGSEIGRALFIVVGEVSGAAARSYVQLAAPVVYPETMFKDRVTTHVAVTVNDQTGELYGRREKRLGKIVLSSTPMARVAPEEMQGALLEALREGGLRLLKWDEAALQTRARVAFMRGVEGETWPDWSDAPLLERADEWLAPHLLGVRGLKAVDISRALLDTLPYELRRRLDSEAPAKFETPAGSSLTIDYTAEGGPALNVRLQELFGLDRHPSVAGGRVPLTLRLLSPAQRPVQTTKDLPGFWRGSYAAVRSEMRGRYPKHPWPDDPLSAPPTRRAKPRGS